MRKRHTGERPKHRVILKIDRLPLAMRDRIVAERDRLGRPWREISAGSPTWDEWKEVPPEIAAEFPGCRLTRAGLMRWHELRVWQVQQDVIARTVVAREIAVAFSAAAVENAGEAVINAARDLIFSILQDGTKDSRLTTAKGLISLGHLMQAARGNELKEKKLEIEKAKVEQERTSRLDVRGLYVEVAHDLLKRLRTREPVRALLDSNRDDLVVEFADAANTFAEKLAET